MRILITITMHYRPHVMRGQVAVCGDMPCGVCKMQTVEIQPGLRNFIWNPTSLFVHGSKTHGGLAETHQMVLPCISLSVQQNLMSELQIQLFFSKTSK